MLDTAWRNLVVTGRNFKFEQIDVQSIPYPAGSFDVVMANHMLYHVPDRPKAIAEISRALKSGGQLIATTVGERQMCEINAWCQRAGTALFPLMPFTLENGLAQLQPYFSQVEMRRYEDSLRITEIEPLMAYIRSSSRITEFSESAFSELRIDLERELQSTGALFVTKDAGLFAAVK
jgi:ubiquinone/menaquinone biosynthesis C-methylase UbiE